MSGLLGFFFEYKKWIGNPKLYGGENINMGILAEWRGFFLVRRIVIKRLRNFEPSQIN
jgi:hypothetical protein